MKRFHFKSGILGFMTPGNLSPEAAFTIAIAAMLALFVIDVGNSDAIRLQALYVFPLTLIVVHANSLRTIVVGYAFSVALQIFTFVSYDILTISKISDVSVAIVASSLTVTLAKIARDRYLETVALAARDSLTGLLNRRSFDAVVEAEISRQRRYAGVFSIAAIDLDSFKQLNDSRGHSAGDDALVRVANTLRSHSRDTDSVGRFGGDEFAVLMPNTQEADCADYCEKLCIQIANEMAKANYPVTASIGYSTFCDAPESTSQAMMAADAAMYQAKAMGKGRVAGSMRLRDKT